MTKAGKRLIEAAKEMVAVAKGEQPAAGMWINGHRYVPDPERFARLSSEPQAVIPDDAPTEFVAVNMRELIAKGPTDEAKALMRDYYRVEKEGLHLEARPRMSGPTIKVLKILISAPADGAFGSDISKATGLGSGTIYPLLQRLEKAKWVESRWECIDPVSIGRPARRHYRLTYAGRMGTQAALRELLSETGNAPQSLCEDEIAAAAKAISGVWWTMIGSGETEQTLTDEQEARLAEAALKAAMAVRKGREG